MPVDNYILILYTTILLFIAMSVYAITRPPNVVNRLLALMLLIFTLWLYACTQELLAPTMEAKRAWMRARYIVIPFRLPLWLLLAAHVSGFGKRLTLPVRVAIFIVPVIVALMALTPEAFLYFRTDFHLTGKIAGAPAVVLYKNAWGAKIYEANLLLGILIGFAMMVSAMRRSRDRLLIGALLFTGLCPTIGHFILDRLSTTVNFVPLTVWPTALGLIVAGMRLRLFDMVPFVVRRQFFDDIPDGVVITDLHGNILAFNHTMQSLLPDGWLLNENEPARDLPAPWCAAFAPGGDPRYVFAVEDDDIHSTDGAGHLAETRLWYERMRTPVTEKHGQIGWIYKFIDITDQVASRAREADEIRQSSETLRHRQWDTLVRDLHDGIGPVSTTIGFLAERALRTPDPAAKDELLRQISDSAESGHAELRTMMNMLEYKQLPWDDILTEVRRFTRLILEPRKIDSTIETEGPPPAEMPAVGNTISLLRIVKEAVNNAGKYSGATQVAVRFTFTPAAIQLTVTDNGRWKNPDSGGRGLRNIRQRVSDLSGTHTFQTTPTTRLTCILPPRL